MKRLIYTSIDLDDDIPEDNKHGNCFVVAYHTFLEDPERYTLVHGVVTGQGTIEGIQYVHAWVLDGNTVIDNTSVGEIDKRLYYAIGNIQITREYDFEDVMKLSVKYGTYGPWDSVFDNYY